MDIKRLITHFTYRIESKADGGFIAHASDPALPALEASTRAELQQKIQANIAAAMAAEFPGLNLPANKQGVSYTFHIENKPEGGFAIHSSDPNAPPIEAATRGEIESRFAEKLFNLAGRHLAPELAQAMAAQGAGDVKVEVHRGFSLSAGSHSFSVGTMADGDTLSNGQIGDQAVGGTLDGSPIKREGGKAGSIIRFLLGFLILTGLFYILSHRR